MPAKTQKEYGPNPASYSFFASAQTSAHLIHFFISNQNVHSKSKFKQFSQSFRMHHAIGDLSCSTRILGNVFKCLHFEKITAIILSCDI